MPPPVLGTLEAALYAPDLVAAEVFYGTTLGLPLIGSLAGRHLFFRVGTSVLLMFNPASTRLPFRAGDLPVPPHGAEGPGHYCFAVASDDLDRWRTHLTGAGIAIEAEIAWPGGGRSLYVRDPAGNSVEFADAALWA